MKEKEINIPVKVIDTSGKTKYVLCHTFSDGFQDKKHKLVNPFQKLRDYITKLSFEQDLNEASTQDNLVYQIDSLGRLYVDSDGLKIYVSEDLKYAVVDGVAVNMLLTENQICFGAEHHFDGPFPYKFLYDEDKQAYLKKCANRAWLDSLFAEDEEEKGKIIDINDYLKKGR